MRKLVVVLIVLLVTMVLSAGCELTGDSPLEGTNWTIMSVDVTDTSAMGLTNGMNGGTGTNAMFGVPMGTYDYVVVGDQITVSNPAGTPVINNDTYTYSISGKNMTWTGLIVYTFTAP